MAKHANITRRAAFTGALVSAAALAMPVSAAIRPTTLEALATKFRDDAQAIDPTITGCFIGYDELRDGPRGDRVMSVYLERKDAPFVRRRNQSDDLTTKWWSQFSSLTKADKMRYAKLLRDADPRFEELAARIERHYA